MPSLSNSDTDDEYGIKQIKFFGQERSILVQNENGPCPLLALCNVLLLRNAITLPRRSLGTGSVTFRDLVEILSNKALDLPGEAGRSMDIEALVTVLPSLNKGLDVNPKFCHGVTGYEYTSNLVPFDLFGVELVHGWVVDPSDPLYPTLEGFSYNTLMEMIISAQESGGNSTTVEAEAAKSFLDDSAHQLTYHGLTSLHSHLPENSLSVFFRNNHFSTIFKHEEKLLLLVTDQGYSSVREIVWEVIGNIDGDTAHVNAEFKTPSLSDDYVYSNSNLSNTHASNDDALQAAIAASLQPSSSVPPPNASSTSSPLSTYGPGHSATVAAVPPNVAAVPPNVAVGVALSGPLTNEPPPSDEQIAQQLQYQLNLEERSRRDEELARQYQIEENQRRRGGTQEPRRQSEKKKDSCVIS
mmetsp:Transcript_10058/g.20551  ORF Transcript_10058/g.20551 Transcript_10058/m.20551 type:complete len:412 (+) Transcript_10058:52-1287(+)